MKKIFIIFVLLASAFSFASSYKQTDSGELEKMKSFEDERAT